MQEYKKFWQNLIVVNGRTRRRDFWVAQLINTSVTCCLYAILFLACTITKQPLFEQREAGFAFSTAGSSVGTIIAVPLALWVGFVTLASIPITVRRLHDVGKPGWVLLLCFFGSLCCGIGAIVLLVFELMPSKEEENQWGSNPKAFEEYNGSASIVAAIVLYVLAFIAMVGGAVAQVFFVGYKTVTENEGVRDAIMNAYDTLQKSIDVTEEDTEYDAIVDAYNTLRNSAHDLEEDTEEKTGAEEDIDAEEETGAEIRVNAEDVVEKVDPNDKRNCIIVVGGKEIGVHVTDYVAEDDIFIYPEDGTPYSYSYYLDKDGLNLKVSCGDSFIQEDTVMDELQFEYDYYKTDSIYEKFIESESGAPIEGSLAGHRVWKCKSAIEDDGSRQNFYVYYVDVGADTLLKEEIDDYNASLTNDEVDKAIVDLIRTLGQ